MHCFLGEKILVLLMVFFISRELFSMRFDFFLGDVLKSESKSIVIDLTKLFE